MQVWIVVIAWAAAVVLAAVVLGFTCYEVSWKTRRLISDGDRLERLVHELGETAATLQTAAERATSLRRGTAGAS
ncbi:MAG: hypothetical protein JWN95_2907 [Frankiales bacterium]|nr:hypothetical protein [Frankiales bacterium]